MTALLPAAEAEIESGKGVPVPAARGTGVVLVVDDEAAVRNFARSCLKRYGYEVLTATNGLQAMEVLHARREHISLMLLDLTMPVMGGEEVLRLVREQLPGLPVILTSGHAENEARKAFGTEAEFLQKPFRSADLASKVKTVLAGVEGDVAR